MICVDGYNDSGALAKSHVGLVLRAKTPYGVCAYSTELNTLSLLPHLFKVGRWCLTTCILSASIQFVGMHNSVVSWVYLKRYAQYKIQNFKGFDLGNKNLQSYRHFNLATLMIGKMHNKTIERKI